MKRVFLFLLAAISGGIVTAQSNIAIAIVDTPCYYNGMVVAQLPPAIPLPCSISWYYHDSSFVHNVTIPNDTIFNYRGGRIHCAANLGISGNYGSASLRYDAFSIAVTTTPQSCPTNGQGVAIANGGVAPYQYYWINNAGDTVATGSPASLYPAYYRVFAIDANGCFASEDSAYGLPIQITSTPTFSVNTAITPANCTNGTATINVAGGQNPPYTYHWANGSTAQTRTNLTFGGYPFLVTDASGCTESGTAYVWQTPNITYSYTNTPSSCNNNGSSTVFPSGGTPPYTYLWTNGQTGNPLAGIASGGYQVTVTDANGCTSNGVSTYVQNTSPVSVSGTSTTSLCTSPTGSASLTINGGLPPYTVSWVTNPVQTGTTATNLWAGYYGCQIMDANGCTQAWTAHVYNPAPDAVSATNTPSSCTVPTGTSTLTLTGTQGPYAILWNSGPAQSGLTASNLPAGLTTYTVTQGATGCNINGYVNILPAANLQVSFTTVTPACQANGSISANVTGGSNYTYFWSNGQTTQTISNLTDGLYTVTATDVSGCTISGSVNLISNSPVYVNLVVTPASCTNTSDGVLTANASGGTPPYSYAFSVPATGNVASGLAPGVYSVTATDATGCTDFASGTVNYSTNNPNCNCIVQGTVYTDLNANCVMDPGEPGIPNIQMHLTGVGYQYSNSLGQYSFTVPAGTSYLSQSIQNIYPLAPCQSNVVPITAVPTGGCTYVENFADTITELHDVKINTWSINCPVPGYNYNQTVIISNQGTGTESDIVAGYRTDGQVNPPIINGPLPFIYSAPNYYNLAAGTVSLTPQSSVSAVVGYSVPVSTPIWTYLLFQDTVAYAAPISNWLNDYSPANNVNYYQKAVVNSYDPNFKAVQPIGSGFEGNIFQTDSVLDYAVHFQNLGTFMALNIYVLDTLDADLDWTTLKPIYLSHPGTITISEGGILKADFPGINLPPKSQSEALSTGMFTYSIRRKANMPLGTEFTNSAAIYFDFNAPVITNKTLNTLFDTTGVADIASIKLVAGLRIFPNPAGNAFSIVTDFANAEAAMITVTNTQGQVVFSQEANIGSGAQQTNVNTSNLASGVYFVSLEHARGRETAKVVILK